MIRKKHVGRSLLMALLLSGSMFVDAQEITQEFKNIPLKNILEEVERKYQYSIIYKKDEVDEQRSITQNFQNATVEEVLSAILDKGLNYTIQGKMIIISRKATPTAIRQEQRQLTGIVADEKGEPIIGANVVEKGTTNGTITDLDGRFTIEVPSGATLQVSYIGYQVKDISVGDRKVLNIHMTEDSQNLDEVVVVGYGIQKKRDVTGAVSSINSENLRSMPVTNSTSLLQGKAAGVMVASESGAPGASVSVRIRGTGTVNNNEPLYVIDGTPSEGMSNLNPADIESVEILKDASAAAIYGSRAANGVVLVTTKKGTAGKPTIVFESYLGASSAWKAPKQMNAGQYYDMIKTAHQNGGTTAPTNLDEQYKKGYNTNWWNEISQKALVQNYYLSASGGSEDVKYAFSGGYFGQDGIIKGSDYKRISFRINSDFKLSRKMKVGINLGIVNAKRNSIASGGEGIVRLSMIMDPIIPVINPNADINDPNYEVNKYSSPAITDAKNPVGRIDRTHDRTEDFSVLGNIFAEYTIIKGLSYKMNLGLDINNGNNYGFKPEYYMNPMEFSNESTVSRAYNKKSQMAFENTLLYNTTIAEDHSLSILAGITAESTIGDGFSGSKQGTPTNDEAFMVLGAATKNDQITGYKNENALLSFLGRVNYNYKNKYLLTASIRRDGSSRFAAGNRWGTFPSASLGWRISEEPFWKNMNATFIDDLKIRAGWGQIGNQNIADNASLSLINGGNFKRYTFGGVVLQGYSPNSIGNPDIRWETVEQSNVALDATLFNNKLSVSIDYYSKKTKDMLLAVPTVFYSGYPVDPWSNAGTVKNQGVEIQLTHRNTISDFNYEIALNVASTKNKVESLGSGESISSGETKMGNVIRTEVGRSIGEFYGYVMDGIFQDESEINSGFQPNARPGDIRFKDVAGPKDEHGNPTGPDGKIDENDKMYIGNPIPDWMLGLNLSLAYKGFDLSLFFQGVFGNEIYNADRIYTHSLTGYYNAGEEAYLTAWHGKGTSNTQPIISSSNANDNFRNSSFFVENGSYLRLKNIQLGYQLPKSVTNWMRISNLRLYVSAQNLFTITGYSGMDPELSNSSPLNAGIDIDGVYPQSRTFMGGLSINF